MPRNISPAYRYSTESVHSSVVDLIFLTISHPELVTPIRVVNDTRDYVRDGLTWIGVPFSISLMSDEDTPPVAQIQVQNVDQSIGDAVREMSSPARMKVELLSSSDFDITVVPRTPIGTPSIEYVSDKLFLADVKMDALVVTGQLVGWDYMQRTWPGIRATQNRLPGLFR